MSTKVPPYFSAPWEPADASAIQALSRGDATPDQQKRALDWTIKIAAGAYNVSFAPGQQDATAFSEGRRFVGLQIIKLLAVNVSAFIKEQHNA